MDCLLFFAVDKQAFAPPSISLRYGIAVIQKHYNIIQIIAETMRSDIINIVQLCQASH